MTGESTADASSFPRGADEAPDEPKVSPHEAPAPPHACHTPLWGAVGSYWTCDTCGTQFYAVEDENYTDWEEVTW